MEGELLVPGHWLLLVAGHWLLVVEKVAGCWFSVIVDWVAGYWLLIID